MGTTGPTYRTPGCWGTAAVPNGVIEIRASACEATEDRPAAARVEHGRMAACDRVCAMRVLSNALRDLSDLVFPSTCVGCSAAGDSLCPDCVAEFGPPMPVPGLPRSVSAPASRWPGTRGRLGRRWSRTRSAASGRSPDRWACSSRRPCRCCRRGRPRRRRRNRGWCPRPPGPPSRGAGAATTSSGYCGSRRGRWRRTERPARWRRVWCWPPGRRSRSGSTTGSGRPIWRGGCVSDGRVATVGHPGDPGRRRADHGRDRRRRDHGTRRGGRAGRLGPGIDLRTPGSAVARRRPSRVGASFDLQPNGCIEQATFGGTRTASGSLSRYDTAGRAQLSSDFRAGFCRVGYHPIG